MPDARQDPRRRLLAGCDADQVAAITSPAAPLLVLAGAGAGKTRVLTRRIAWQVLEGRATPGHVLALTFTRKAAGELRARLTALGLPAPVTAGTFHAVALSELRRRACELGRQPPVLVESKARLLAAACGSPPSWRGSRPGATRRSAGTGAQRLSDDERERFAALAREIEWAKARLVPPHGYVAAATAAGRRTAGGPAGVAEAYAGYEAERRRRRLVDFDDLLALVAGELEADPDFAAAQRWRFAHLFVDELQDATPAQLRLLDGWLGGRPDLFAVGDPRQAVYGWNGADPSAVLGFSSRYPGAEILGLDTNYRSSPQVVAVAAAALAGGPATRRELAVPPLEGPTSGRPEGPVPTLTAYPDEEAEAEAVAAALRRLRPPGRAWSACAVLARTNAQLSRFEEVLGRARIPCRAGSGSAFLSRPAVRSALADLARAPSPAAIEELAERCGEALPGDPPGEAGQDLAALGRLAGEYLALDPLGAAYGFLAYLRGALRADPSPSEAEGVTLTTFHRAKGLEWPVVFVTGLEDGFVPIAGATTPAALEEERRLLYVALSRAEEELHCSWSAARTFSGRRIERAPSPYIEAIEGARRRLLRLAAPAALDPRAGLAEARAALGRARSSPS